MNLEAPRLVESSLIKESTSLRSCCFVAPQGLLESLMAATDDRVDFRRQDSRCIFYGSQLSSVTVRESARPKTDTTLNPNISDKHKDMEAMHLSQLFGSKVEAKLENLCVAVPTPLSLATKVSILQSFRKSAKKVFAMHSTSAALVLSCVGGESEEGKAARGVIIENRGIATFLVLEVGEGFVSASFVGLECPVPLSMEVPADADADAGADDGTVKEQCSTDTTEGASKAPTKWQQSNMMVQPYFRCVKVEVESGSGCCGFGLGEADEACLMHWFGSLLHARARQPVLPAHLTIHLTAPLVSEQGTAKEGSTSRYGSNKRDENVEDENDEDANWVKVSVEGLHLHIDPDTDTDLFSAASKDRAQFLRGRELWLSLRRETHVACLSAFRCYRTDISSKSNSSGSSHKISSDGAATEATDCNSNPNRCVDSDTACVSVLCGVLLAALSADPSSHAALFDCVVKSSDISPLLTKSNTCQDDGDEKGEKSVALDDSKRSSTSMPVTLSQTVSSLVSAISTYGTAASEEHSLLRKIQGHIRETLHSKREQQQSDMCGTNRQRCPIDAVIVWCESNLPPLSPSLSWPPIDIPTAISTQGCIQSISPSPSLSALSSLSSLLSRTLQVELAPTVTSADPLPLLPLPLSVPVWTLPTAAWQEGCAAVALSLSYNCGDRDRTAVLTPSDTHLATGRAHTVIARPLSSSIRVVERACHNARSPFGLCISRTVLGGSMEEERSSVVWMNGMGSKGLGGGFNVVLKGSAFLPCSQGIVPVPVPAVKETETERTRKTSKDYELLTVDDSTAVYRPLTVYPPTVLSNSLYSVRMDADSHVGGGEEEEGYLGSAVLGGDIGCCCFSGTDSDSDSSVHSRQVRYMYSVCIVQRVEDRARQRERRLRVNSAASLHITSQNAKGREEEKGKGREEEKGKGREEEKGKGREEEKGKGREEEKGKGREEEKAKEESRSKGESKGAFVSDSYVDLDVDVALLCSVPIQFDAAEYAIGDFSACLVSFSAGGRERGGGGGGEGDGYGSADADALYDVRAFMLKLKLRSLTDTSTEEQKLGSKKATKDSAPSREEGGGEGAGECYGILSRPFLQTLTSSSSNCLSFEQHAGSCSEECLLWLKRACVYVRVLLKGALYYAILLLLCWCSYQVIKRGERQKNQLILSVGRQAVPSIPAHVFIEAPSSSLSSSSLGAGEGPSKLSTSTNTAVTGTGTGSGLGIGTGRDGDQIREAEHLDDIGVRYSQQHDHKWIKWGSDGYRGKGKDEGKGRDKGKGKGRLAGETEKEMEKGIESNKVERTQQTLSSVGTAMLFPSVSRTDAARQAPSRTISDGSTEKEGKEQVAASLTVESEESSVLSIAAVRPARARVALSQRLTSLYAAVHSAVTALNHPIKQRAQSIKQRARSVLSKVMRAVRRGRRIMGQIRSKHRLWKRSE